MDCEPGNSKWLAKGNPEKCPLKGIQTVRRVWLRDSSLSLPMYLSTRTVLLPPPPPFYLPYCFLPLWKFFSAKPKGQGPLHWPLVQWLGFGALPAWPDLNLWEPKPHFKMLQPENTRDHIHTALAISSAFLRLPQVSLVSGCSQVSAPSKRPSPRPFPVILIRHCSHHCLMDLPPPQI